MKCDLCKDEIKVGDTIYDARIPGLGVWAWLCEDCFDECGCNLGIGHGQQYEVQQDGLLTKIGG